MPEPIDWNCDFFVNGPPRQVRFSREELAKLVAERIDGQPLFRQIVHPQLTLWVHHNPYCVAESMESDSLRAYAQFYLEIKPKASTAWEDYLGILESVQQALNMRGFEIEPVCSFAKQLKNLPQRSIISLH